MDRFFVYKFSCIYKLIWMCGIIGLILREEITYACSILCTGLSVVF